MDGRVDDPLRYCETRKERIEFSVGCDVTQEFKRAVYEVEDWKPLMKE
jgi:hypothetical protein